MDAKNIYLDTNIVIDMIDNKRLNHIKAKNLWQYLVINQYKIFISEDIELSLKDNLDLEDTLECLCAKSNGCNTLITHDKKFYDCGIDILTIDEFINKNLNE